MTSALSQANTVKFITVKPETSQTVQKIANRFWLAGILSSIAHTVFKVSLIHTLYPLPEYQSICFVPRPAA
jgi:hypothetical protein